MRADHTPTDETVLRLATREELCGPGEPRMPLTAEEAALVAAPAAPLSPQDIAEMRNAYRRTTPGRWNWWTSNSMYRLSTTHDGKDGGVMYAFMAKDGVPDISASEADRAFIEMAHNQFPRLLDAIEALTAENARLTSEREKHLVLLSTMAERADRLWNAPMQDVIAAIRPALVRGSETESPLTPGEALAPLREAYPPPRLDDGIDMDRLGRLCREEQDADAERQVEAMMAGIPESPLSHPRYPALVKMARESVKDGD